MNCNIARTLIPFARTESPSQASDLSVEDHSSLNAHLATCHTCSELSKEFHRFDQQLARSMKNVPVPEHLEAAIIKSALAARGALLRKRIYQYASLAALVFVAVGIATGIYWKNRPQLDGREIAMSVDAEFSRPQETVESWLIAQDLPRNLPLDFDFRLYTFHGQGILQGHEVPMILFQAPSPHRPVPDFARLYIIKKNRFNLKDLTDAQASEGSIKVLNDRPGNVVYVIIYSSLNLDPFLRKLGPLT